jgi:uncharacterized protein (TIGR00730 family)
MQRICVFCGAKPGADPAYLQAARAFGELLAVRDIELVYGGGRVGLMGAVADAVLAGGGAAIGVIPQALAEKEVAHEDLTQLYLVSSMHERKATMAKLSDAFVALPGGFGTLEEFCEVITWAQLGLHSKPCGLLDVGGFWQPLTAFFDGCVEAGFVGAAERELVLVESAPDRLLERLETFQPLGTKRWIQLEEA